MATKKCPYCSEEILITAKKCKHCGEWLEEKPQQEKNSFEERRSSIARGVTKGLKDKELHDNNIGCGGLIALVVAVFVGVWVSDTFNSSIAGWTLGLIFFIVLMIWISKEYYKE